MAHGYPCLVQVGVGGRSCVRLGILGGFVCAQDAAMRRFYVISRAWLTDGLGNTGDLLAAPRGIPPRTAPAEIVCTPVAA